MRPGGVGPVPHDAIATDAVAAPQPGVAAMVRQFHATFRADVATEPSLGTPALRGLRLGLIREEVDELADALDGDDLVAVADALGDIAYVVYGAAQAFGIDLDAVVAEIHRSNMTKLGPDGTPIHREDGKVLKGPDYEPPNLRPILGLD